jgi:hypothetical protein
MENIHAQRVCLQAKIRKALAKGKAPRKTNKYPRIKIRLRIQNLKSVSKFNNCRLVFPNKPNREKKQHKRKWEVCKMDELKTQDRENTMNEIYSILEGGLQREMHQSEYKLVSEWVSGFNLEERAVILNMLKELTNKHIRID